MCVEDPFSQIRSHLQIDIFSQQLLLIPFHLGVHWATVVVDFAAKEIVYYDSKPNKITSVTPPCLYSIRYVIKTCLI